MSNNETFFFFSSLAPSLSLILFFASQRQQTSEKQSCSIDIVINTKYNRQLDFLMCFGLHNA